MEDRSNKTIMSSVLFLDIVEYSKKSVSGQISLKERFNAYLAEAIKDMPVIDRIILDTGDGAAVNFLGDVEDALKAALSLRESLLSEDLDTKPELLVRIGINLGPVRLMRDLNGQPNIVGDGINVAQRVMGFADPSQILVSRSYYDAVSRLSAQYAGMFHYQGSRTDKHVREHEVYAIGYPGDHTTKRMPAKADDVEAAPKLVEFMYGAKSACSSVVASVDKTRLAWLERIKQADTKQRVLYGSVVAVPLLMGAFALMQTGPSSNIQWANEAEAPAAVTVETMQAASGVTTATEVDKVSVESAAPVQQPDDSSSKKKQQPASNKVPAPPKAVQSKPQSKPVATSPSSAPVNDIVVAPDSDAYILVSCKEGTQVFVDGSLKGTVSYGSLTIAAKPGVHKLIVSHASFGLFNDSVTLEPGKIERVRPRVCR